MVGDVAFTMLTDLPGIVGSGAAGVALSVGDAGDVRGQGLARLERPADGGRSVALGADIGPL